jgi:hypothetical protein
MKKILLIAAMLFSTSALAVCPASLSGTYSGQIKTNEKEYKTIVAKFASKNTINITYAVGTSYDSNGDRTVNLLTYPQFLYSYDKTTCILRAWPVNYNTSQYDLFLSVASSGSEIEGFQIDPSTTYNIRFTKQ